MTTDLDEPITDVGAHYGRSRQRIQALLRNAPAEAAAQRVAACPGWSVHDVIAHLVGVIEDAAAGRLSGVPTEALTATQVERHTSTPIGALLDQWDVLGPVFQIRLTELRIWPALFDVLTHEHDIRTALQQPGARNIDSVRIAADLLRQSLPAGTEIRVVFTDLGEMTPTVVDDQLDELDRTFRLTTTRFEFFRLRMGRRSADQVEAMQWSRNPTPVLHQLFVFGPAAAPLVEDTFDTNP